MGIVHRVALRIAQLASPALPSAGENILYPKSDDKWYSKNSAGTEVLVGPLTNAETLNNKATSTALGTSDTYYPTQNAVKTYVDYQKHHSWGDNTYGWEDYSQAKNMRWFIDSAAYAVTRFSGLYDAEYHNGTSWVSWATGTTDLQPLFDGREDTGYNLPHTYRRFRVKVQVASTYPLMTLLLLQSQWTAISWSGDRVITVETSATQGGTYTVRDTATFGATNTAASEGWHIRATDSMHVNEGWWRITVEIPDWTDNGGYTTIPLRRLEVVSGYQGRPLVPFSWNYSKALITKGACYPDTTNAYTLGASTLRWSTIYGQSVDVSGTLTGTSGTSRSLYLTPTINQSSSAGYSGVDVEVTETATGSGSKRPFRFGLATVTRWWVDNTGAVRNMLSASGDTAGSSSVVGDAYNRFYWTAAGVLNWGSGAGGGDVNLYRSSANVLKTDDALEAASMTLASSPTAGDSTTKVATTAFVQNAVANPVGNPYLRRYKASNQSVANNTWETFLPGTEDGVRGTWNYSSGILTIPEAGLYHITASITFNGHATGRRAIRYRYASTVVGQEARSPADSAYDLTLVLNDTIYLTIGSFVDFQVFQNSGAALDLICSTSTSTISIAKVGI
jgi:hypothetical protein